MIDFRPRRPRTFCRGHSHCHGFTLVELLIALVVFAILGFAVTSRVGDVVTQLYGMERRAAAHWVAGNQLARLKLAQNQLTEPLAKGRERERVFMAGREWRIDVEIEDTSHPWLRRVELAVYEIRAEGEVGPLEHLTAFVGRY